MGILTIRQKQQLLANVLVFLLIAGFIGGIIQGNPVALTILGLLLAMAALIIVVKVHKGPRAKAALPTPAPSQAGPEKVEIHFQIPIMSNDTLDSLTVRIQEHYEERGGSISVSEAKAMAKKALDDQTKEP